MSDIGGNENANVEGEWILDFSPEDLQRLGQQMADVMERSMAQAMKRVNATQTKGAKAGHKTVEAETRKHIKTLKAIDEAEAKARLKRLQTILEEQVRARDRAHQRELAFLRTAEKAREAANARELEQMKTTNRRGLQALEHFYKEQRNVSRLAHEKELEDHKQAYRKENLETKRWNQQQVEATRQTNRLMLQANKALRDGQLAIIKGTQQRLTAAEKAAHAERLQAQRTADKRQIQAEAAADKIKVTAAAQAEKRKTMAQEAEAKARQSVIDHEHRRIEEREKAHYARRQLRVKAFWSIQRSIIETGGRFMASATKSVLDRILSMRRSHDSRMFGLARSGQARQNAAVRGGMATQEGIVSRSLVRQQGAYMTFQQATMTGSLRFFRNMRMGMLALGGGLLGARALQPGIDFNILQQSARAGLETILGSAEAANEQMDRLVAFSKTSPFPIQNFIEAQRGLIGAGIAGEEIVPIFSAVQDAVAAMGGNGAMLDIVNRNIRKIATNNKITAEELNSMGDAGINALQIMADQAGVTGEEMRARISDGAVGADEAIRLLTEGMTARFGGSSEALKETMVGTSDRIKAAWRDITATLVSPFISPTGGGLAVGWGNRIADGMRVLDRFLANLFTNPSSGWSIARSALLGLGIALSGLLAYRAVGAVLQVVAIGLKAITAHPIIFGIGALAAGLTVLIRHVPEFGEAFSNVADVVSDSWGRITEAVGLLIGGDFSGAAGIFGSIGSDLRTALDPAIGYVANFATNLYNQIAPAVISAWDRAFAAVAGFIRGGGLGRVADAIGEFTAQVGEWLLSGLRTAFTFAVERVVPFVQDNLRYILLGAAAVGIAAILGPFLSVILGAIGGSVVMAAIKKKLKGPIITAFVATVTAGFGAAVALFPEVMLNGLHNLGRFIGGPVVATIFSDVGVRIMAGIAGGLAAGAFMLATGLIDGLRDSLPKAIGAIQGLVNDLVTVMVEAIRSVPILGSSLEAVFIPVEVVLRGILPTLEVFARILGAIPTPVYVAGAALFLLSKAIIAVHASATKGKLWYAFTWLTEIPRRAAAAGASLRLFGTNAQWAAQQYAGINATFAGQGKARVGGTAGISALGRAASGAGLALSGVAAAMPAIGMAAMVGLPIALGLWESAKARTQQWRQEVDQLGESFREYEGDAASFITREVVANAEGLAEALSEAGVSAADFGGALGSGDLDRIGEMLASSPDATELREMLDGLGISMADFAAAALQGDNAVKELGDAADNAGLAVGNKLKNAFKDLPSEIRDTIEQFDDMAQAELAVAHAAGRLTDEQEAVYLALLDGEDVGSSYTAVLNELSDAEDRSAEAVKRRGERVADLISVSEDARASTDSFRDAIDRLTGSAIDVRRSSLAVVDTVEGITEAAREGASLAELEGDFLSLAENIIAVRDELTDAGKPRQAEAAYGFLREGMIRQYRQMGVNREEAEAMTDALIPDSASVNEEMDRVLRSILRKLRRQRANISEALLNPQLTDKARDNLEEYRDDLQAEISSYDPLDVGVTLRGPDSDYWAEFASEMRRQWLEQNPDFEVRVTHADEFDRPRGFAGNAVDEFFDRMPGLRPITGRADRAGADLGGAMNTPEIDAALLIARQRIENFIDDFSNPGGSILDRIFGVAGGGRGGTDSPLAGMLDESLDELRRWSRTIDEYLLRVQAQLRSGFTAFAKVAKAGGEGIVKSLADALSKGTETVGRIVEGYGRQLADALNPILGAIGEEKITVERNDRGNIFGFAQGGIPGRIAKPSDGPIVHVYNEGATGTGSRHGEAYIPFDPVHRGRSRMLAAETVRRLGGEANFYAAGGINAPMVTGDTVGLVPEFLRRLSAWAQSLGQTYNVGSGYRSYEEQASLYADYMAGVPGQAPAAPPGSSMHNFGLASDGNHWSGLNPTLFGLRYPMSYEPWHVEPAEGRGLASGSHGFWAGMNPLPKPPDAGDRGELSRVGKAVMQHTYDKALAWASSITMANSANLGTYGTNEQVQAWIGQAVDITKSPEAWIPPLVAKAMQESSGNPRAVNNWDSNAAAGTPSKGLMQTIDPTFNAYKMAGYDDIWNPVHNAIAAIRYIVDRYGTPFNLPSGGYRDGGIIDEPTLALMGEDNKREVVLPLENRSRLRSLLTATGLWADIAAAAEGSIAPSATDSRSAGARSTPVTRHVDLHLTIDGGGDVDPTLYSELAGAVRSGVSEGLERAEELESKW